MTTPPEQPRYTPSRRDLFRPLELLGLSGALAVVIFFVVLMSTRNFPVSFIAAGLSFILTLVVLAMLALTAAPSSDERGDLREQDGGDAH